MGMRVHGSSGTSASSAVGDWQQRQQNVKTMLSDIQSGDLAGAQKAYASLQDGQSGSDSGPFAAIGKALQSGDIQAAQQAATDFQARRAGGHHHHGQQASGSEGSSTVTSSTGPLADSGTGSNIHYVA